MEDKQPVYINGEPVYDLDHYTPGQKRRKATTKNLTKKPTVKYAASENALSSKIDKALPKFQNIDELKKEFEQMSETNTNTNQNTNFGKTSMILGILSIFLADTMILGLPLGVAALITANKSTNPEEENSKKIGRITAFTGIAISIIIILTTLITAVTDGITQNWLNNY